MIIGQLQEPPKKLLICNGYKLIEVNNPHGYKTFLTDISIHYCPKYEKIIYVCKGIENI